MCGGGSAGWVSRTHISSTLNGTEWSVSYPGHFTPWYPLDTKKGESLSLSEQDKKSPDPLELEPRFLGHLFISLVTISEFALLFGN